MRPKSIKEKCYVFDFDETLVQTDAKVYVVKNGKRIKSLNSTQLNTYKKKEDEELDLIEFIDPRIIMSARKYKMWPTLVRLDHDNRMGKKVNIYILTARPLESQIPIHNLLKREKIEIPIDNIITTGDLKVKNNAAIEKEKVLRALSSMYDVYFFDDAEETIKAANKIPGIKTKLIDSVVNRYIK